MDVKTAVHTKYAVRDFTAQPLPENIIMEILEAGRRAQSSKNTQPWQFILVQDRERLQALSRAGDYTSHVPKAAAFLCFISRKDYSAWEAFDFGQAAAYIQLAAWELGVGSCIATFHRPDQAAAVLGLPADKSCWMGLSLGYPAPDFKPAKMGGRKSLDELIHRETW